MAGGDPQGRPGGGGGPGCPRGEAKENSNEGETTRCIGAVVQKPEGIDVINRLFELWTHYLFLHGRDAGCGHFLNAASRQPRVTGEPGGRRRPAVRSPGRAALRARGWVCPAALPRPDPWPRPERGRGRAASVPGRAPLRAAPTEAGARAAPSSPHRLPRSASARPGCPGSGPRGASTVPAVPALLQPCPGLRQHCPKAVPDRTSTVPDVSALSRTVPGQFQSDFVPGCPSIAPTVPALPDRSHRLSQRCPRFSQ